MIWMRVPVEPVDVPGVGQGCCHRPGASGGATPACGGMTLSGGRGKAPVGSQGGGGGGGKSAGAQGATGT